MAHSMNSGSCPEPFLPFFDYPPTGGDIGSRFCATTTTNQTCCLPCPATSWVYSDVYEQQRPAANYISILSFVLNLLLLLTFAILPEEQSHRHYLSVGLTASLAIMALAFIIPLGTKPDICYDKLTPNNMHSDMSCGWTGALLELGAMGAIVWILLRSVWTALRIAFNFKRIEIFKIISIILGIGLPVIFLAIELPVAGVTYRFGDVCLPTGKRAFAAWFGWLLAFATLSWFIQIFTIVYCVWKFALSALSGAPATAMRSQSSDTADATGGPVTTKKTKARRKVVEWRRVKRVLYFQWRTLVLSFVIANITIYFGIVFIQSNMAAGEQMRSPIPLGHDPWTACLIEHEGDKDVCLNLSGGLGLSAPRAAGTIVLASLIGPAVFLLMLRWSMFVGWWQLIRNPRALLKRLKGRKPSVDGQAFGMGGHSPKHLSLQKPLGSEQVRESIDGPSARDNDGRDEQEDDVQKETEIVV